MAVSVLDDDNTFDPHFSRSWDTTPSHAPTPGYFGGAWTPSLGSASPEPAQRVECRSPTADPVSLTQMVDDETLGVQLSDCNVTPG
ncbi:hypothetical protein N7540_009506 [Penicillium herquei]|nr:hypothetical protein N7540_009506 [Penicillium herquei]